MCTSRPFLDLEDLWRPAQTCPRLAKVYKCTISKHLQVHLAASPKMAMFCKNTSYMFSRTLQPFWLENQKLVMIDPLRVAYADKHNLEIMTKSYNIHCHTCRLNE